MVEVIGLIVVGLIMVIFLYFLRHYDYEIFLECFSLILAVFSLVGIILVYTVGYSVYLQPLIPKQFHSVFTLLLVFLTINFFVKYMWPLYEKYLNFFKKHIGGVKLNGRENEYRGDRKIG